MILMTAAYAVGCIAAAALACLLASSAFVTVPPWLMRSGFAMGCTAWALMVIGHERLQRISGGGVLYSRKILVCFAILSAALGALTVLEFNHPAKYIGAALFLIGLVVAVGKILLPGL